MDPVMTSTNFREFLMQIGKYLREQDRNMQYDCRKKIMKKMNYIKTYKESVREFEVLSNQPPISRRQIMTPEPNDFRQR